MNAWDLSCRSTNKLPLADFSLDQVRQLAGHHHNSGLCIPLSSSQSASTNNSPSQSSSQSLYSLSTSPTSSTTSTAELSDDTNHSDQILVGLDAQTIAVNSTSKQTLNANELYQSCSQLDRKARKKDQNRRAAYNYRRKKMEEKNRMREEEMRLVYSRVCLIGYAEELEGSITYILSTKTKKILDKDGNANCFLCPVCLQSCDNTLNLRDHLNVIHYTDNACL